MRLSAHTHTQSISLLMDFFKLFHLVGNNVLELNNNPAPSTKAI